MHVQSRLHPVLVEALKSLGMVAVLPTTVLPLYAVKAAGLEIAGFDTAVIKWAIFCDIWPIIAVFEAARRDYLHDFGYDPNAAIQEAMEEYDDRLSSSSPSEVN